MFYSHIPARKLVSLVVCFALSWVLIVGSVSSPVTFSSSYSSFTLLTKAFADDMMDGEGGMPSPQDAPATTDALTDAPSGRDSDDGDDDNNDDDSNDIPKDAPLTAGTLTTGGDSDNDDENDDSGRDNGDEDDDNEPTSKDAPATTDTLAAKKIKCPKGQAVSLFSTSCEPASGEDNTESSTSAATVDPKSVYEPPAAALPFRGNEIELINSYDQKKIEIKKYDTNGPYGRFTFTDGTIKEGKYGQGIGERLERTTELQDIKIKPGPGTPLDGLGVKEARLPFPGSYPEVHYKDGIIVHQINIPAYDELPPRIPPLDSDSGWGGIWQRITVMDSKGKVVEKITVDKNNRATWTKNPSDNTISEYKEDGSYVKTWPKKADGSQQFYDSKQQKVFVRDADGNIIPPKE